MPANQFFTDWVTGETITAAKLNTMKNSVQPYFGNYTPVNKAGDTMSGLLNIKGERLLHAYVDQGDDATTRYYYLGRILNNNGMLKVQGILGGQVTGRANIDLQFSVRNGFQANGYIMGTVSEADIIVLDGGDSWHYVYLVTNQWALVNLELSKTPLADLTFNGTYQTTMPGGTLVYQLSTDFTSNTHPYTLKLKSGSILGRYDHQNRFVFCGPVGYVYSIPPSVSATVATFVVNIPTGKSLYLRRCRFRTLDSALRLRVFGANGLFTSTTDGDDITPNVLINNSGTAYIVIGFYNTSGNNVNTSPNAGYWVEFEIA